MKKRLPALLCVLALAFTLIGCGGGGGGTAKTRYVGFDPKGDYLEYAIDMANGTIDFINHTMGETYGPYNFTRIIDGERTKGFSILYETEIIPKEDIDGLENRYLVFALMDKVALFAQMQDSQGTPEWTDDTSVGNPVYALSPRYTKITEYQGRVFNFVKFKIVDQPNTGTYSNSEGGFFAFDTNEATVGTPAGRVFGAAFSHQTYLKESQDQQIKYPGIYSLYRPDEYEWGTSSFSYDENIKAYTLAINEYQISLIGTESEDIVIDFGPGQGGAFAIRQAKTEEFQPQYHGTYLLLVYCEKSQTGSPEQTVRVYRAVLGDNGNIAIDNPWDSGDGASAVDLTPFKTFNPGLFLPVNAFKELTKCDEDAIDETVKNAYLCHGVFCYQEKEGGSGAMLVMDPGGNYLCFTLFEDKGGGNAYEYSFGFGIKDPGYLGP